jgi:hypothetical protein
MKKVMLFILLLTVAHVLPSSAQPTKKVKKVLTLEAVPGDGGSNGASIVWHPVQKKYYAAMAGNASFQLGVFDAKGKSLADEEHVCNVDVRAVWYNPVKKMIQGNGYDETGYFSFKLNSKGMLSDAIVDLEGSFQPDAQSAGAYNPTKKQVYFLKNQMLEVRNPVDGEIIKEMRLYIGYTKKTAADAEIADDADATMDGDVYNTTTPVYTGMPNGEIGILNVAEEKIELYSLATGYMTSIVKLPTLDFTLAPSFNFAYTNGMFWICEKEARVWRAFK